MTIKRYIGITLAILSLAMGMTACSDDESTTNPQLVENARVIEDGQTLSPGETVHLAGDGYLESDDVMLDFYWETGDPLISVGSIIGYYAEILESSADGITVRLPYRKPESRVEVILLRSGTRMLVGELFLKDGATPKDARLYGINNNLYNKGYFTDATQITRCVFDGNAGYGQAQWTMDERPDFHSVVSCWQCYGLCGLSKIEEGRYPFFFDFCSAEWKQLGTSPTIALFALPSGVGALQQKDKDGKYGIDIISNGLDKYNYATAASKTSPMPQASFPLPDNLTPEQFGDYPGAYTGTALTFFSANKGNGKWSPVIFDMYDGFHVLDDIEADGLIPFSFIDKDNKWRFGYIIARDNSENGSELYLSGDDVATLFDEPYAVFPNRAVSVSANYENPGTLTVHFLAYRAGNVTYDFLYETKTWEPMDNSLGWTFDEMVWTN